MLTIITGASENHAKSLRNFLQSIATHADIDYTCIVYDLGLAPATLAALKDAFDKYEFRYFDFSKYPAYFNITVAAGEYAWKPAIVYEVSKTATDAILWCDAGDLICGSLKGIYNTIKSDIIFSTITSGDIKRWTHPLTLKWFGIDDTNGILRLPNRNGAIQGFDCSIPNCRNFIKTMNDCAHDKTCIAPEGSSRANHRQDQAVFTILYYIFRLSNPCKTKTDFTHLISIHNDCD